MKKFFLLLILLIAALTAWFFFLNPASTSEKTLQTATITKGDIESLVTATGTLEPKEYVNVGAQVSGQIKKLHVDIGDSVKKGDLLAEIDPDVYTAEVTGDEAKLKTLNAQFKEQTALFKQAQLKLERNAQLLKSKAISQETYEDTETNVEVAKAQLESLQAQIEEAQSTLEKAKTNLNYTKIYATMDGTITSLDITEGETINASQNAPELMQIADLDIMTVQSEVAEADIMKLQTGMSAYFTTLGSQERKWTGTIRQILPTPEIVNDVVLYNVLIDVNNTDHALMSGMTTQVFFILGEARNVPLLPVKALGTHVKEKDTATGKAYTVWIQNNNGKLLEKTVLIGLADRTNAAVLEGLNEGDVVVTEHKQDAESQGRTFKRPMRL